VRERDEVTRLEPAASATSRERIASTDREKNQKKTGRLK
jgi:hypothetical protein